MKTKKIASILLTLALTLLTSCKDDEINPWLKPGVVKAYEATDITLTQAKLSCSIESNAEIQNASVDCHFVIWDSQNTFSQETVYPTIDRTSGRFYALCESLKPNTTYKYLAVVHPLSTDITITSDTISFTTKTTASVTPKIDDVSFIDDFHVKVVASYEYAGDTVSTSLKYRFDYYKCKDANTESGYYIRGEFPPSEEISWNQQAKLVDTIWVDTPNGETIDITLCLTTSNTLANKDFTSDIYKLDVPKNFDPQFGIPQAHQEPNSAIVTINNTANNNVANYFTGIKVCNDANMMDIFGFGNIYEFYSPIENGQITASFDCPRGINIYYAPYLRYYDERNQNDKYLIGEIQSYKTQEFETIIPSEAEAVDLGLSVKWAPYSVGQMTTGEPPLYLQWTGEDIANSQWHGSWRLPSKEEVTELYENCTVKKYVDLANNTVCIFTSKINGNSITFIADFSFWTSENYDADHAWAADAYSLSFWQGEKNDNIPTRPVTK